MSKVLEQLELTVSALGKHCSGEWFHDLLDRDRLVRISVVCRAHEAKSAHSYGVEVSVPVGDFEHSAEDLSSNELFLGSHCERRSIESDE